MKDVKIYLKTALFALRERGADTIPANVLIISAEVLEQGNGGITINTKQFFSIKHEELKGENAKLYIPSSKIDHIRILDE